jgi:LacI family transcriptional regulator
MARGSSIPAVRSNEPTIARMIAAHFVERGFQHFGFCGFPGVDYSDKRADLLAKELARRGFECQVYAPPAGAPHISTVDFEQDGIGLEEHLCGWLRRLPKPAGIMACNDIRGLQVLNACRRAGMAVPEQVAVIGVDNDEVLCQLANPPLSSVVQDTVKIGYEAAALLSRMMDGEPPGQTELYVEPLGIALRRSTDTLVIPHAETARALSFLRRHYHKPITLKDLAAELSVTLRSIQGIFKAHVGRSLHGELDRLRVGRAKELLRDSALKLESVAAACGFSNPRQFRRTFLRETGQTPQQRRRDLKTARNVTIE